VVTEIAQLGKMHILILDGAILGYQRMIL